jgi:hypothetical protein
VQPQWPVKSPEQVGWELMAFTGVLVQLFGDMVMPWMIFYNLREKVVIFTAQ